MGELPVVPRWLALTLVAAVLLGAGALLLPAGEPALRGAEASFSVTLWEQRGLDTLVQVGLIFAGTLGVLGLLSEKEGALARDAASLKEEAAEGQEPGAGASKPVAQGRRRSAYRTGKGAAL